MLPDHPSTACHGARRFTGLPWIASRAVAANAAAGASEIHVARHASLQSGRMAQESLA